MRSCSQPSCLSANRHEQGLLFSKGNPVKTWIDTGKGEQYASWAFLPFLPFAKGLQCPGADITGNNCVFNNQIHYLKQGFEPDTIARKLHEYIPSSESVSSDRGESETLHVLTANSQSLADDTSKTAYELQLSKRKVHISAFQGTRANKDTWCDAGPFIRIGSKGLKGQFGCSIYINKSLPLGKFDGQEVYPSIDMIEVLGSQPRWLVIKITCPLFQVIITYYQSTHAWSDKGAAAEAWWNAFHKMQKKYRGHTALCLGDANTSPKHLYKSTVMGCLGMPNEGKHCHLFEKASAQNHIRQISTFPDLVKKLHHISYLHPIKCGGNG